VVLIIAVADPWKVTQFSGTNSFQLILTLRLKSSSRFAAGADTNLVGSKSRTLSGPSVSQPATCLIGTLSSHPPTNNDFWQWSGVEEGTELGD